MSPQQSIKLIWRHWFLTMAWTFISLLAHVQAAESPLLDKAALLFETGRYELAKTHFDDALDQQPQPSLHYNLALIDLKLNQPAAARWHIEQARLAQAMPAHYRLLENKILEELKLSPRALDTLMAYPRLLIKSHWMLLASLSFWSALLLLVHCCYNTKNWRRKSVICAVFCAFIFILSVSAVFKKIHHQDSAIILAESPVSLLSAPTKNAPQVGLLQYGARVHVIKKHLEYFQVTNPHTATGWLPKSQLRIFKDSQFYRPLKTTNTTKNQR